MAHPVTFAATPVATRWFLGVPFQPVPLDEAVGRIVARGDGAPFAYLSTPNAQHVVALARGDARYAAAHDGAWLVTNDSAILRLLARWLFGFDLPQAAGSDITAALVAGLIDPDDAISIIGGSPRMEAMLRERLGWRNVRRHTPPMGFTDIPGALEACVDFIAANPARFVFIVMGAPRSEQVALAAAARGDCTGTALAVGSALDFSLGIVARAPRWARALSIEWLYRLAQNPRAHWRRVVLESLPVLGIALRARLARDPGAAHRRRP